MNELINTKKKSEILAETIANMNYGEILTHKQIEEILQEKHKTPKYNSEVARAKKIALKNYNKCIENIRGDGYRILYPDNYTTHSLNHYKRGFKELQKGKDVLDYAPINDMSEEGQARYKRVYDRSVILLASMKGAQVELKTLDRPKNPLSPEFVHIK